MNVHQLIDQAMEIWVSGGWAMILLAVNSLILFTIGFNLLVKARGRRYRSLSDKTWRRWIGNPAERRGHVGEVISFMMSATTLHEMSVRVNELHASELAPFARDLRFMKRAVSTAPLLGLLGTVTGMLATFQALATGSGGQHTMEMIASGISEALITTETGLVIALPGLFFQYHLGRERDRYEAFLAHVESACAQALCVFDATRRRLAGGEAST